MPLRILLVDDHETMRMGVRALIDTKPDWQVCGEAVNGKDAIAKVAELAPDVVILDLSMRGMTGFEAAEEIRLNAPSIKIIYFSAHPIPVHPTQIGADAFVSKDAAAQDLITAIERLTTQRAAKTSA